jgi:phosphoribosylanthranilate isomerase
VCRVKGWRSTVFVKICGITNEEDALMAVALGADALGFVFATSSRQITPGAAADIIKRLPPDVLPVGVFRDQAPDRVIDVALRVGCRGVQLHGHETPRHGRSHPAPRARADRRYVGRFVGPRTLRSIWRRRVAARRAFAWLGPGVRLVAHRGHALEPPGHSGGRPDPGQTWPMASRSSGPGAWMSPPGWRANRGVKDPRLVRSFIHAARDAEDPVRRAEGPGPFDWDMD